MTKRSLVDPEQYLGTITEVSPSVVQANLPRATAYPDKRRLAKGTVGDFVFVDCEQVKLLGRIIEVRLPDSERLTIEPKLGAVPEPNPLGRIKLLATVDQSTQRLQRGLRIHPRVGDAVYLADGGLFAELVASTTNREGEVPLEIGTLDAAGGVVIKLSAEKIFGRHCGLFGSTGGGKSWTIATLISQVKEAGGRAILLDPTGEFADLPTISKHYTFNVAEGKAQIAYFPYQWMTEDDLFTLSRPSGQSQGPKLREAIKSLKLVDAAGGNAAAGVTFLQNGCVEKAKKPRAPFFTAIDAHKGKINSPFCTLTIGSLADQITHECVWSTDRPPNTANWGDVEQNSLSHCETLIFRLRSMIHSVELSCLFGTSGVSLVKVLEDFFKNDDDDVIRISFKNVRFEHSTREILLNVIGRYLLNRARESVFRDKPMIVFLDEAHQFLGRIIGDEFASVRLDAFGLIAKEGRKYGLTCALATQRPRDIPADVLSQLGTLIVHRLTNDNDRETIEKSCGDLDRDAAMFLPTLAPGEAIVIGPDVPAPVPLLVRHPGTPPNSQGPPFGKYWTSRRQKKSAASKKVAAEATKAVNAKSGA
jgi:DNA helicase HerA-like ATPase